MAAKEANQDNYFDKYDDYERYYFSSRGITFYFFRLGRFVSCCFETGGNVMPTSWVTHGTLPERFKPVSGYSCAISQPASSTGGGARWVINADGTVQTFTTSGTAQSVAGGAYIAKKV